MLAEGKEALPDDCLGLFSPVRDALFACPSAHHLSLIEERPCLSLASLARFWAKMGKTATAEGNADDGCPLRGDTPL